MSLGVVYLIDDFAVMNSTEEFVAFLDGLKSPDNSVRDAAEAHLDQLKSTDCAGLVQQFFNALASDVSSSMKAFIAVILRKVITSKSWDEFDDSHKASIRGFLLELFGKEPEARVRRAMVDIISQVHIISEGSWPELYPFIVSACNTSAESCVEALYLLGLFCENDESTFADNLNQIVGILSTALTSGNYPVQISACLTALKILETIEVDQIIQTFVSAIPAILGTVQLAFQKGDEDNLISLLEDMDTCMEACCSYVHDHIRAIVDLSISIAQETNCSPNIRQLASHIIATIGAQNGAFFRKNGQYITQYLNIAAQLISDIDDDPNWENNVFGEEDELIENDTVPYVVGINMVANISVALHGAVYKPATQLISQCKNSNVWQQRRVAYVMICHIVDGCKKQVEADLKTFNNIILEGLNDSHPRVVFVALQAIAYCSVDLPGLFQKKCGVDIIRGILGLAQKNISLNLQAMTASCLGQFCAVDQISKKIFKNSLSDLVAWLLRLTSVDQPAVQTEVISAIGYLSRATKDDFAPFFNTIVQGLLGILSGPVMNNTISVHVSASVCLSNLVSSMGTASSKDEAWNIMQFLMNLIEKTPLGDERLNCLLDCASEIYQYVDATKQTEFLNVMIPYLVNLCKLDIDVKTKQVVSGPDYANVDGVEITTIDTTNMGKVQISINTTAIETVTNAVRLLHNIIIDGKQALFPYAAQIYEAIKPLIDFAFHEETRNLTARILPKLFEIMINGLKDGTCDLNTCMTFYKEIILILINQYHAEEEATERACIAESIRDVFCLIYESGDENHHQFFNQRFQLSIEDCESIASELVTFITDSCDVLEKLYQAVDFNDREMDDARNEFEEAAGEEKDCVENLLDGLGYIIRYSGDNIANCFMNVISGMCTKYMNSPFEYIRFVGICAIDDMMLYAPSVVQNIVPDIMNFFGTNMTCEDPCLRQAVLYGIKIIVEKFPAVIQNNSNDIMMALCNLVSDEASQDEEYCTATDNALSAIFSLLLSGMISGKLYNNGLQLFVEMLPMQNDYAEAQTVHEKVVYALKNTPMFNNVRRQLLMKLPYMLLPCYDDGDNEYEIAYDETKMEIVQILNGLKGGERMDVFRNIDPEVKDAVMLILGN